MHSGILRIDAPQNAGRETGGAGHAPRCTRRRDRASVEQDPARNASDGGGVIAHTMPGSAGGGEKPSSGGRQLVTVALQGPPLPVVAGELRPPDRLGSLAKGDRRAHDRGRGPRPHCPQRLSHRTQGRVPAQAQRAVAVERRLRLRERLPCRAAPHRSGGSCGVVDEPFGPARALRDVWTSRGRGWRLAHRVDHTRGLLAHRHHRTTTTTILSIFGFIRPDGRKEGAPAAPGPREQTTVIAFTAVLKSGKGWSSASLPASKRRNKPRLQSRERLAR